MEKTSIKSSRLILRPFTISDTENYFDMLADSEIQKYINFYPCFLFFHEVLEKVKEFSKCDFKTNFYFVIENSSTHELVGALLVKQTFFNNKFRVTMMIHKDHRKKGYMTEALNAFIDYIPCNSKLVFIIYKKNYASLRTVGKLPGLKKTPYELDSICDLEDLRAFTYKKPKKPP